MASGTHLKWSLNRAKKHNPIYYEIARKVLQKQSIQSQLKSLFTPASNLKLGTFNSIPNFTKQKIISKKLQAIQKGPYQISEKPTDVTFKVIDHNKKETVCIETSFPIISKKVHSS